MTKRCGTLCSTGIATGINSSFFCTQLNILPVLNMLFYGVLSWLYIPCYSQIFIQSTPSPRLTSVFNRQRQDERIRRGGEQKSVVILSERPYSCVFKPLVQIAGPLYFDIGARALEQVASYVPRWAPPHHGQLMELLVGSISHFDITIRAHLPLAHTLPPGCGTPMDDFTSAMAPVSHLNRSIPQGVFHDVDLFGSFRGVLMNLWDLWELLLVGEPLMVIAPTPSQVCEAVAALVSLVAPLPCSVDFRPYFTVHDQDFSGLNSVKEGEKGPPMRLIFSFSRL